MKFLKLIIRIYMRIVFNIKIEGMENIPQNDGVIIAPNHISNYDPLLVVGFYPRPIKMMAKAELFSNPITKWFFTKVGAFPVNRGEADISAVKTAMRYLKNQEQLLVFPHGTRVNNSDDTPIKEGVILIAQRAKKNIVPAYITGPYRFRSKVVLRYGKPFDLSLYFNKRLTCEETKELSDKLWNDMKLLKEGQ